MFNATQYENFARLQLNKYGLFDWHFEWEKTKRIFGRCWFLKKKITLSRPLAELNSEEECRDVILHELSHALAYLKDGDRGHGRAWKKWCVIVGARPERCYSSAEVIQPKFKYEIVEVSTGKVLSGYHRKPKYRIVNQVSNVRVNGRLTKIVLKKVS